MTTDTEPETPVNASWPDNVDGILRRAGVIDSRMCEVLIALGRETVESLAGWGDPGGLRIDERGPMPIGAACAAVALRWFHPQATQPPTSRR